MIAAEKGAFTGKPRPWVVVQNTALLEDPRSITVCAISSDERLASFRIPVLPTETNGLRLPSLVLGDKLTTIRSESIDRIAGELDPAAMRAVDEALRLWLDL